MKHIILFFMVASFLFACSSDKEKVSAGKYGMMSDDTPQYTAVLFMRSIYNEDSLDKAIDMSTERFARILKGHHTNKNVQRQVFNLRLDSMTSEPVSGGSMLFSEKQKKANIDMKIIGEYEGDRVVDLKTLSMVKVKGEWKVQSVRDGYP